VDRGAGAGVTVEAHPDGGEGQQVFDVTRPPFGARGDGRTDDTAAIQRAVDAARAARGGIVRFPRGTYMVTTVYLVPGITLQGEPGATVRRPVRPPRAADPRAEAQIVEARKWMRMFTTQRDPWDADTDSPPLVVRGLTFDGNHRGQGQFLRYELQQGHLLFLMGATSRRGRLRAIVENCTFRDSVGDGVSVYTNASVRVSDCVAIDCFRGGVTATGGHSELVIERLRTEGSSLPTGIDVEIDGEGYRGSLKVDVRAEDLDLDADFDVNVSPGGSFTGTRIVSRRPPFFLAARGGTVDIRDSRFAVGPYHEQSDRVVWPHRVTFTRCVFTASEAGTTPEANRSFAALHVYWNVAGTTEAHQRLRLVDCDFAYAPDIEPTDTLYAVYAEADLLALDNWLQVQGGNVGSGFDEGFHMAQGGAWAIDGATVAADTAFWWSGTGRGYGADLRLQNVRLRGVSKYMHIQTHDPGNRLTHRSVVVDEAFNRFTTQYGLAGNVYAGGRVVLGTRSPVGRAVPGLAGDVFRLKNPVAGEVWEWNCVASHPTSATWRAGAVYGP
jgi:hypothetical protein